MMYLRPSDVLFCQDSISCMFDIRSSHSGVQIGQTLDNLCEGRCSVSSIPTISVMKRDGRWVTADNRRLWVFRQLERLGKCDIIPVRQTGYIPASKFTSDNNGQSIYVRGSPGGRWHLRPTVKKPALPPMIKKAPVVIPYTLSNGVSIVSKPYINNGFVFNETDSGSRSDTKRTQTTELKIPQPVAKRSSGLDNIPTNTATRSSSYEGDTGAGSYNDTVRTHQIRLEEAGQKETGLLNRGPNTLGCTEENLGAKEQTENTSIDQGADTLVPTDVKVSVVDQTGVIKKRSDRDVNVDGDTENREQTTVSEDRLRPVVLDIQGLAGGSSLNNRNTMCGSQRTRIFALFGVLVFFVVGIIIVLAVVLGH